MHFVHNQVFKKGDLFVLVVSLVDIKNNKFEDLEYWLCFLYYLCTNDLPLPLLVIGTFSESLPIDEIKEKLKEKINAIMLNKKLFFKFSLDHDIIIVSYTSFPISVFSDKHILQISEAIEKHHVYARKYFDKSHSICLKDLFRESEKNHSPLLMVDRFIQNNPIYKNQILYNTLKILDKYNTILYMGNNNDINSPINNTLLIDYQFISSVIQQIKKTFGNKFVKYFFFNQF